MKTLIASLLFCGCASHAATTIDSVNRYAYGANVGWMNGYADGANGAVIGDYVCMGCAGRNQFLDGGLNQNPLPFVFC